MMVGRPRKTELELLVTGQWRRDRHGSRSQGPTDPLGDTPRSGDRNHGAVEATSRHALRASAPRCFGGLEIYAQLLAEARADFAGMSANRLALLSRQGARLGLGPHDRTRLMPAPPPKPNRF